MDKRSGIFLVTLLMGVIVAWEFWGDLLLNCALRRDAYHKIMENPNIEVINEEYTHVGAGLVSARAEFIPLFYKFICLAILLKSSYPKNLFKFF